MTYKTLTALALMLLALMTGCGGAIAERRAKLATVQPTPSAIATEIPQAEQIQNTPPQPASVATGIEGEPWLGTFTAVSAGLMFVAVCGGVVYLYVWSVGRWLMRRNSHLFTHGGNNQ